MGNIPQFPEEAIIAAKEKRLIVFLGAVDKSEYTLPDELKEKYLKGYNPEHDEFLSYTSSGWIGENEAKVFSGAELLAQGSAENIVRFLQDYQAKKPKPEEARSAGLTLKDAIITKQEIFNGKLKNFFVLNWEYWFFVLRACNELMDEDKLVNLEEALSFALAIVKEHWEQLDNKAEFSMANRDGIVTYAADLVKKSVKNDEMSVSDKCLDLAYDLLKELLQKQPSSMQGKDEDALTDAINTAKGHIIDSLFYYSLRKYRMFEKLPDNGESEKNKYWSNFLESLFEAELKKTEEDVESPNYEFLAIAGAYLPNLYYMSNRWVTDNFNRIFNKDKESSWRCAMSGYSYVNSIYAPLYKLLKDGGHLQKALITEFESDAVRNRIIQNIGIMYLRGEESLDDGSLFKELLKKWRQENNSEYVTEIVNIFWSQRNAELKMEHKQRIYDFWEFCINSAEQMDDSYRGLSKTLSVIPECRNRESIIDGSGSPIRALEDDKASKSVVFERHPYQDVLSDLNLLAVFLDEISAERKNWLLMCAPHVDRRHHSAFLLEYLDKLAERSPAEVGEIYVAMLGGYGRSVPTFREENITTAVEKLFKSGNATAIEHARTICDRYSRAGHGFLTPIYMKYKK